MIRTIFISLRRYLRRKRYQRIQELSQVESLTGLCLDLGGGMASFFARFYPFPDRVVLIDINEQLAHRAKSKQPQLIVVVADGCRLPLASQSVDMTICNSVIEHVYDPDRLASEIRRVSRRYFLQTPNGYFPMETHSFIAIPFYRYIPSSRLRKLLCRLFGAKFDYLESVEYLSEARLRKLFPEATLVHERWFGLTKSFYLYSSGHGTS